MTPSGDSGLTTRDRFRATMNFQPGVRTLNWEFGYWVATMDRWYGEGLRRTPFSPPPGMPEGDLIAGEGLAWPYRPGLPRYRDVDVHNLLGLDPGAVRLPIHWRHSPQFTERTLHEDDDTRVLVNSDGVTVKVRKAADSLPQELDWPVHDRASWEVIKAERFGPDISSRFPARWEALAASLRGHDFPLGTLMDGFFSMPRELMGLTTQLMMYYDDPALMHDIGEHLARVWLAVLEELLARVDLDFVVIWEDMAFKNGPLVSPAMFRRFITPYYRRVTGLLHARGVETVFVDTDGNCSLLIPEFLAAGVDGLYPFEVQSGMDIVEVRRQYPELLIQGGLDKRSIARGSAAIDAELAAKLPVLLRQGGYIPYADHLIPPDVSWDDFVYYRNRVAEYITEYSPERSA